MLPSPSLSQHRSCAGSTDVGCAISPVAEGTDSRVTTFATPRSLAQEAEQLLPSDPAATSPLAGGTDLFEPSRRHPCVDERLVLVDLRRSPAWIPWRWTAAILVIGASPAWPSSRRTSGRRTVPMLARPPGRWRFTSASRDGHRSGNLCQEPRCWYYRSPGRVLPLHRERWRALRRRRRRRRYHSIFGAARVVDPPCTTACPNDTNIPAYVETLRRLEVGLRPALLAQNPIPAITGRIWPHLCETGCNRGTWTSRVSHPQPGARGSATTSSTSRRSSWPRDAAPTDKSVTMSARPRRASQRPNTCDARGHTVTVLEKESRAGGMLSLGIPPFRLSREIVDRVLDLYTRLGVQFASA